MEDIENIERYLSLADGFDKDAEYWANKDTGNADGTLKLQLLAAYKKRSISAKRKSSLYKTLAQKEEERFKITPCKL